MLSHVRLSDLRDCSPPGSSIHGIFQARVLEWGAIAFSDNFLGCIKIFGRVKGLLVLFYFLILSNLFVRLVKAVVFPVVMYGCESWTIMKAQCRRIDAFELWCWRRLLRVPWTARRPNQPILMKISPGVFLEGMMLKLKLQYFGHLMRRKS